MPAQGSTIGYSEETVVASAARTTNGNTSALPGYGGASTLRLHMNVSAVSGTTPTLDVIIEDTLDGTNWVQVAAFAQVTATGTTALAVTAPFSDRIRARWTVGGTTPSFTFSVRAASQSPLT